MHGLHRSEHVSKSCGEPPGDWETCGYHEIRSPPRRYRIIDREGLAEQLGLRSTEDLVESQQEWIAIGLAQRATRDPIWSESLAVGSERYVQDIKSNLGPRGRHRTIATTPNGSVLREPHNPYSTASGGEMGNR
jgi:putative transposase